MRSVQQVPELPDWARVTFDDDTNLDLPRVCLTIEGDTSSPAIRIPSPRSAE